MSISPWGKLRRWYIALPAMAIGGVAVLYFTCGMFIAFALNRIGPKITGTDFSVSRVGLSPLTGHASVGSLRIGNPSGFSDAEAIYLRGLSLRVRIGSLFGPSVHLHRVSIRHPKIHWESGQESSNIQRIQQNIQQYTGAGSASSAKRFRIDHLSIEGATVRYQSKFTADKIVELSLPDIELRNLGYPNGITSQQLTLEIFKRLNQNILRAIAGSAGKVGGSVVDGIKGLFRR